MSSDEKSPSGSVFGTYRLKISVEIESSSLNDSPFWDTACPHCGYDGLPILNEYWPESARCGRCGKLITPKGVIQ